LARLGRSNSWSGLAACLSTSLRDAAQGAASADGFGSTETLGECVNKAQSMKVIQSAKTLLAGLLLITLAVAVGLFLGNAVFSPNWQAALRFTVIGGLVFAILMSPVNGLFLWMTMAPYAQAPFTELWRILNIRLPPGIPSLTPDRLSVGLLCVVLVAQLAIGKRRMKRLSLVEISMAAFCVLVLPSVAASMSSITRVGQLLFDRFITPFLIFVLAKNLYEEKAGLEKLCAALAVIGFYLSFMVFYEQITGQPLFYIPGRTTEYTRSLRKIVSLLGNPAFLGTVLGMIAPLGLYKFVRERSPYSKAFYGLLFATAMIGNFFCYNRGAWLALAVAVILLCFVREYRRILLPVLLIIALIALVRWQIVTQSAVVTERLANVTAIDFRLAMLEASKVMIRNHLLFGVGFDDFAYYYLYYGGHWDVLAWSVPSPHNSYLLVLVNMGLFTLISYVLIFLSMFFEIVAMLRRSRGDERVDRALLVSGLAVITVYAVSAAAVDLYFNVFTSQILFLISGTILGYISHLRSSRPRIQEARE